MKYDGDRQSTTCNWGWRSVCLVLLSATLSCSSTLTRATSPIEQLRQAASALAENLSGQMQLGDGRVVNVSNIRVDEVEIREDNRNRGEAIVWANISCDGVQSQWELALYFANREGSWRFAGASWGDGPGFLEDDINATLKTVNDWCLDAWDRYERQDAQ